MFRPGAVLAEGGRAVAWGEADVMRREHAGDASAARVVEHGDVVLMPGLINAHAHLELSAIGPRPYGGDFSMWLASIRRHVAEQLDDPAWFASAAARGAADMVAAGVEAVGDIAAHPASIRARIDSGLRGVSFREWFGIGPPWDAAGRAAMAGGVDQGVGHQPHAPYSAGPALYAAASSWSQRSGRPVCTHLSESLDESLFVTAAAGACLRLLEKIGKWDASFAECYGRGLSPVRWMEPYLRKTRWLVAHCNYVDDEDLRLLAETGTSVAYCPVASAYFGHEDHRYRDMLRAGINVCLGTDSIVCQPPEEPQPQSVLPPMRFLYRRDGTDPSVLFRMATVNGRRALRLDDGVHTLLAVRFDPSDAAGPLVQVLRGDAPGRGIAL